MEVNLYSRDGNILGREKLPTSIFEQKVNEFLISEVVRAYMASARDGNASTKKRGEVRGGGRKPWRQKHSGRTRAGSIRSPIWKGGGVTFGPKPRDYSINMPKKKKRLALISSLSLMAKKGRILLTDEIKMEAPRTKEFYKVLKNFGIKDNSRVLFATETAEEALYKSARNIPGVTVKMAKDINALLVLSADTIIFSLKGLKSLEERLE